MHGIIIEFIDPKDNIRRSATYLPEVAAHEGIPPTFFLIFINVSLLFELVYVIDVQVGQR